MKDETLLPDVAEAVREALDRISCPDAYMRVAVEACLAALQSGNSAQPVTVPDEKLPLDYLQGQKDGLEWAAQMAEANHPETGDWLYDDPLELAKAIRKGPDMPNPDNDMVIGIDPADGPGRTVEVRYFAPPGYALVPVEPTPEMLTASYVFAHIDNTADSWKAMLAAAPKSPSDQLTPAPEDRLQKAIFNACIVFLYGCGNGYKNHEGHFYDVETEHSFCIWEIAEQIGVVKETGNYKWSLCKEMEDDIEEVYRKYAMRIMDAAPKVKP